MLACVVLNLFRGKKESESASVRKRRLRLLILLLLPVACASISQPPVTRIAPTSLDRPNIVLIIGDDHGFPDFGFMGSPIVRTPNLDRLAAEGTVFTLGYSTSSKCRPALLSLLTGLGIQQYINRKNRLKAELEAEGSTTSESVIKHFRTLPRVLAQHGYRSFQAEKYWESHYTDGGFTHGMGEMKDAVKIGRETLAPVFDFIDGHLDSPFFLWFAPKLPHLPFDAPPEFADPYADFELPEGTRGYYANISRFDAAVGELLNHLEQRGLREKTLIVYVVDNGWQRPKLRVSPARLYHAE